MKKKLLLGLTTACVATLALASCGGGNNELKTMSMFGGADAHAPAYEQFIKEFEKENNIKVKDNSAQADQTWKTGVISAFKSGNAPDVLFYFTGADAKPLTDEGLVVPVSEIRKEYPNYGKNVDVAAAQDPYAITLKGFVEGLFVNTDVLKNNDLKAYADKDTWTWEDFLAVSDKLHANNVTPVALGVKTVPHYWIEHLVFGMAGAEDYKNIPAADALKNATGEGNTAADKWVKGLKMFNTLAERGVFGPTKGNQEEAVSSDQFKKGKAAMQLDGSWFAGQFAPDKNQVATHDNVKMIPFPAIPESEGGSGKINLQSGFTSGFFISKKAWDNPEKRDAAVKFVEKMSSTAAIAKFCKDAGGIPADSSVVIEGQTNLEKQMNAITTRDVVNSLPLSNMCKAGSFDTLVGAAPDYLLGKLDKIQAALEKFANEQK